MLNSTLVYNDDGFSSYMRYPAPMSPEEVVQRTVLPLVGTGVGIYQFGAMGGHVVNYRSGFLPRLGDMMDKTDTMHVWRMRETLQHLEQLGTDPLHVVSAACHEHGIKCQFSLRMNDAHHTYKKADGTPYFPELVSSWLTTHPEVLLPIGTLDYAHPEVHTYRKAQIREALDNYQIDGVDLDFTRLRPWFREGGEAAGRPLLTRLVREIREMTGNAGKTLSARFEYDPRVCLASGLAVDQWLTEGLLDQITLGGIGDQTPDAPAHWWIEQAHPHACQVYPGIEGQLHWVPGCGAGGTGTRPGNGVEDGFGPPSLNYMRAIAAVHYRSGADGLSLFNFASADGAFARAALTELADPLALQAGDKQYVAAVWPSGSQIYYGEWISRFRIEPGEAAACYVLRMADDLDQAHRRDCLPSATLTLDLRGINRLGDVEVSVNGTPLRWNGYHYNHYDHGCWDDLVQFALPVAALRCGSNTIELRRVAVNSGFAGAVQVRKCIVDIEYPKAVQPGSI